MADVLARLLPKGVGVTEGDPPEAPSDFGEAYAPPAHCDKPLSKANPLPREEQLVFFEEPHIYTFRDVPATTSVTSLAHEMEGEFVAKDAIEGMKASRKKGWPREDYVVGATRLDLGADGLRVPLEGKGGMLVQAGNTLAACMPQSLKRDATCGDLVRLLEAQAAIAKGPEEVDERLAAAGVEVHLFDRVCGDEEIEAMWADNARDKCNRGTEAHYQAELFVNGLPCRSWEGEVGVLLSFLRSYALPAGLKAFRTELEIYCEDADVAGSIDLILHDPALDVYHIVDHKRSDKLRDGFKGFRRMKPPFSHLQDCKGAGYTLQLSLYQYILEREYGLRIGDRVLLSLHPDVPCVAKVPYLKAEVEYIMEGRFGLVRARREAADENEAFRCQLTGAPAVDAVVLEDGKRVMGRKATLLGLPHSKDEATRRAFEEKVSNLQTKVELDVAGCKPWFKTVAKDVQFL